MSRKSVSGFPEWSPSGRIVEQFVLDHFRRTFELHGFSSLETRAVEALADLEKKGETSKEVYVLERLQDVKYSGRQSSGDMSRQLGLHFDLTIPLARYVLENKADLTFPYKRYQIQKVWRGERPQNGRFREFIQADIDVVGDGQLPPHYEIELPLIMAEALSALPIPPVTIMVNNRKLLQGVCEALDIKDFDGTLRILDKLDKIGAEGVKRELEGLGLQNDAINTMLHVVQIHSDDPRVIADAVAGLGLNSSLLEEGTQELCDLLAETSRRCPGAVVAYLKIARGLDYYTGTVYESVIEGHEDLGSICSGGRYDSLVSDSKRQYPGVGLSIGVSRLISRMLALPLVEASRSTPTAVLVAVNEEADRSYSNEVASQLRSRGIPTDVSPSASKFGKQIKYADRLGIPFVWFPGLKDEDQKRQGDTVKDIRSGEQEQTDPLTWAPAAQDLWPTVKAVEPNS